MKKIVLRDIITTLREEVAKYSTELGKANQKNRALQTELTTMRSTWRPIPIVHPWEPRDPRCALCDDPRDSSRHPGTVTYPFTMTTTTKPVNTSWLRTTNEAFNDGGVDT